MTMESVYIDIKEKWGVIICHDFDERDEADIANYMVALGSRSGDVDEALDVLLGQLNTGLCITNPSLRMSLIFIGEADSAEQWWDTLTHELYHAQQAICRYYGVDVGSEDGAWTMGYLMRKSVGLLAPPCI